MKITFSPASQAAHLHLAINGKALTVNGKTFDFSALQEGDILPAEAVDTPFLTSPVKMIDGEIAVTVRLPHGANAPEAARFPEPVTIESGVVAVPAYDLAPGPGGTMIAVPHAPEIVTATGTVDLSQISTAAARAADARAEWRARASLSKAEFAQACFTGGIITKVEALAWLRTGQLPSIATSVLSGIADQGMADAMELAFTGADRIGRANPFLDMLRQEAGLSEEELDALFGWPAP